MTTLNVEPGGYCASVVRFSAAPFWSTLVSRASRSSFGSNDGDDAMTRTLPVCGSSATTAPLRPLSALNAARCAFGSSVVMSSSPAGSLPASWSTTFVRSSSWPVSSSFLACSIALRALGSREGAVVALEPQTGRVRVMASNPAFDPDRLRDARDLKALEGSAVNRTTQGQYPPGSTFKVVTAAAAIDSGRYTKDSLVDGRSPKTVSGTPLQNFDNEQYGTIPLTEALTNSVNTVWAEVAAKLGPETMERYMERFGFYDQAVVDLPTEQRATSGVYVDREGRRVLLPPTSRFVDVGRVAIGQGGLLAPPLQMAMVAAAVANDGRLMRPTIADRIVDRDGRTVDDIEPEELSRPMKTQTAREIGDMMASVVREGTGTAAALSGLAVAGKTGTAQIVPERNITQPWFIGFAPRDDPKVAVAVTIERSTGTGGVEAAPIAKRVMETLLR